MKDKIMKLISEGKTHRQIRDILGVSLGYISRVRNEEVYEEQLITESEIKTSFVIPKESNELLKFHGYNPKKYELVTAKSSQWEQQSKNGIIEMKSSKISVKPKPMEVEKEDIIQSIKDLEIKSLKGSSELNERISTQKLASVEIYDLHLGKLGWGEETGTDYDMKIAEKEFFERVEYFSSKIDINTEKILFILGNDFFHYDNEKIETYHGTLQDTDTRPKKMFKKGLDMVCSAINHLSQIAPVDVLLIPGNHSSTTIYYLAEAVNKAFQGNDNVFVDTSPKTRKYYEFGNVLLGFAHSDEENKKELEGLMQKEVPEMWGRTRHREFHFGHIHIERVDEKFGLKFRWVPSISGVDNWHYKKGYIQTERVAQMFIYDKIKGLETIYYR